MNEIIIAYKCSTKVEMREIQLSLQNLKVDFSVTSPYSRRYVTASHDFFYTLTSKNFTTSYTYQEEYFC